MIQNIFCSEMFDILTKYWSKLFVFLKVILGQKFQYCLKRPNLLSNKNVQVFIAHAMYDFVLPTPAPRFPKEDLESSLYIESVCTFILKCYYTPVTIYLMHQGPKQKSSHKFT